MEVVDPRGVRWRVRRGWLPRHEYRGVRARLALRRARRQARRAAGEDLHWYDFPEFPAGIDSLSDAVVVAGVVLFLALFVLYGVPLLLALVDLVVIVLATVLGVLGRLLLRRPWTVEAVSATGQRRELPVVGWRRAGVAVRSLAAEIRAGR